ncbi:MAG: (6-4) photolyase [Flavobacteriaceae bacterium]|jgi:deoxyribodipyrimidine photolyase-related protein|nr:cryptochrome/photolyase family protein [Flavobacteriaceae bacterium]CAI8203431.1 MAG: (6-4) photolyase [Flavobacteriaceae bacterium]
MATIKRLRLILGDQLNARHSWYKEVDTHTLYCMAEMYQESNNITHHIQKVTAFFQSMRNFAGALKKVGAQIDYQKINQSGDRSLKTRILEYCQTHPIEKFEYQLPDNYRLDKELKEICSLLESRGIQSEAFDTEHFLTSREELSKHFEGKKQLLMESFYRMMRKKHHILMLPNGKPEGAKWNYDSENRKGIDTNLQIPKELDFKTDVTEVYHDILESKIKTLGVIHSEEFPWPTSRKEGLQILQYFCDHLLSRFGTYQDAMAVGKPYLFHSRISFALNSKLIHPREVIDTAIATYYKDDTISLSQIEGFVRQILGWREYMRGIYWKEMPNYQTLNYFNHKQDLPDFYWTSKTKMKCLSESIKQTLEHSYAHHIQRLMVTGNYALLTEIDPDQLDDWYLGVYIDAIHWVEITNTRGMSQFADGGIIATKPYISSGAYINKMSNYCKSCSYRVQDKTGEQSCPFNSLYWNFLSKKRETLKDNPRMGMMYRLLDKKNPDELEAQIRRAEAIIRNPNAF